MKKILTMFAFVLTIAAQAEKIDSTLFVAFYNYTIQTQDDEGRNVTDSIRLALQVGTRATYCNTVLAYNKDGRPSQEMTNSFIMHHQAVLTDMERAEVVAVETIYPYRYESHEPPAKVNWTLTNDTMTICEMLCYRAIGKLYGKQWTVWYTEDVPSSAGPWKLRGLPGLIVRAEDSEGFHCFELYGIKNEVRGISNIDNPNYQKLSRKKLMEFKKKVFGNVRYVKDPIFYVPNNADDVGEVNINGTTYYIGMNSHMMILKKSHVYRPLELE